MTVGGSPFAGKKEGACAWTMAVQSDEDDDSILSALFSASREGMHQDPCLKVKDKAKVKVKVKVP